MTVRPYHPHAARAQPAAAAAAAAAVGPVVGAKRRGSVTGRASAPKRNKRAGKVSATAATQDEAQVPASLWCQGRINPFGATLAERQSLSRADTTAVIEIFLPAWLYKKKPTYLVPEQGHDDQRTSYARFVYLFGYLANKANEPWHVPDPDDARKYTTEDSPNKVIPTLEVVVTPNGKVLGYRLRLTELQARPNGGMAGNLAKLILDNNEMARKTAAGAKGGRQIDMKTGAPRAINRFSQANITTQVWQEMAMHVTGPAYIRDAMVANPTANVALDTSAFHLHNVCSLEHSHRIARTMGAAAHYCDMNVYVGEADPFDGQSVLYGFPVPARVYMLHDHHLLPSQLDRRWFPIRQPDPRLHARGRAEYESVHGVGSGVFFDQFCVTTSASSEACDIWALTAQVAMDRKEIAAQTSHLAPDVGFAALRAKQLEWQTTMSDIIEPRGDVCPSMQHLAAYRDAWLQENGESLRVERAQTMANLSRFGDFWAQQLVLLETVAALKTAHKQIIMRIVAYLTVHLRTNDRIHIANFGPAMSGKSFAMVFCANLFVEGTSMNISDITQRALCTPGKGNDGQRLIVEDAQPSLLGAQQGNKTGQGGGMGEKENMMKGFLTSMRTALLSVNMEPSRRREHIVADTCSTFDFAMNVGTDMFDPAMLSRFNVVIWPNQDRVGEGPDMITRNMRSTDSEVKAGMQTIKTYWSRTEVIVSEIEYRLAAGMMPGVTMDAATMLFGLVAAQMKRRYGVCMQDQRHFNRFKSAVQVLCIQSAVDLIWDSPLSPIKDETHSDAHFLLVEKHLVATVEQAVFALGLFSNQWQDDLSSDVLRVMKTRFFPNCGDAIAANAAGVVLRDDDDAPMRPERPDVPFLPDVASGRKLNAAQDKIETRPDVQQYRREAAAYDAFAQQKQDWMYASLALPSNLCPRPPAGMRGSTCSQQELAEHLAQQIYRHLKEKPLISEVVAVIMRLMRDTSDATRVVQACVGDAGNEERAYNVPSLVLTPDVIKMSLPVLARADQVAVLLSAVTEVVQALYTNGAITPSDPSGRLVMLYGETERNAPYVWKLVEATRQRGAAAAAASQTEQARELMRVRSANFFDPVLVESTAAFLRAIEPIGTDENRLLRLFKAQTPWFTIDTDLDAYAVEMRSLELGLNPDMQERGVSNRTVHTERLLFEAMWEERAATLPADQVKRVYPTCFSGMDSAACFAEHRRIEGFAPERYSLRARQEASLEKRKTFASFEDMSTLLERMQRDFVDVPQARKQEDDAKRDERKSDSRADDDDDQEMADAEAWEELRVARGGDDDEDDADAAQDPRYQQRYLQI